MCIEKGVIMASLTTTSWSLSVDRWCQWPMSLETIGVIFVYGFPPHL